MKPILYILLTASLFAASCTRTNVNTKPPDVDYYTCTMHPSVHIEIPDQNCPICGMKLVPVMKKTAATPTEKQASSTDEIHEFVVPVERQQQIGVTYAVATRKQLHHVIRSVGMVEVDTQLLWEFVARVDGYIQALDVTSPGQLVAKDQALMTIYSPDLLTGEKEFVDILQMRDKAVTEKSKSAIEIADRMLEATRRRLRQWNITDNQLADLEKTRKPADTLTLLSPFRGIVKDVSAQQGRGVKIGDPLVAVADLSRVWVTADFYENELSMLQTGQKVTVTTNAYAGMKFEGEIAIINPFVQEMKRTGRVRIDIHNPEFMLRPGMYVNVDLPMDMGEALTIPIGAVMPTGERNVVFIDKGDGRLEPRVVQLGMKYGDDYAVESGLKEGERVVSSANFLIDAESKTQGALKSFHQH